MDGAEVVADTIVRTLVLLSLFDGMGGAAVALAKQYANGRGGYNVIHRMWEYTWELLPAPVAVRMYRASHRFGEYRYNFGPRCKSEEVRSGGACCFRTHNSDVCDITEQTMRDIVAKHGCECDYLVSAGSPCQDLASVNTHGKGLSGKSSCLFFLVPQTISWLQNALADAQDKANPSDHRGRVIFIVENVASMATDQRKYFSQFLGAPKVRATMIPLLLYGETFTHATYSRRRLFWTNLVLADEIANLFEIVDGDHLELRPSSGDSNTCCRRLKKTACDFEQRRRYPTLEGRGSQHFQKKIAMLLLNPDMVALKPLIEEVLKARGNPMPTLLQRPSGAAQKRNNDFLDATGDATGEEKIRAIEAAHGFPVDPPSTRSASTRGWISFTRLGLVIHSRATPAMKRPSGIFAFNDHFYEKKSIEKCDRRAMLANCFLPSHFAMTLLALWHDTPHLCLVGDGQFRDHRGPLVDRRGFLTPPRVRATSLGYPAIASFLDKKFAGPAPGEIAEAAVDGQTSLLKFMNPAPAPAKPAAAAAAAAPRPGQLPLAPMAAAAQLSDAQRSAIARKREEAMARLALKRKRASGELPVVER